MNGDNRPIVVGKLGRARGLKGEMMVTPLTDFPERFDNMTEILVADRQDWKKFEMVITGQAGGRPIIKLKGIDSPEQASRMVNRELAVTRRQLTELPAGRYFIFDLIGMEVVTHETGASVGRLVDVRQYPANDVYVIETPDGRNLVVAGVTDFVKDVDLSAGTITVAQAGLVDSR